MLDLIPRIHLPPRFYHQATDSWCAVEQWSDPRDNCTQLNFLRSRGTKEFVTDPRCTESTMGVCTAHGSARVHNRQNVNLKCKRDTSHTF